MKTIKVGFYAPSFDMKKSNRLKLDSLKVNSAPYYLHGYFKKNYSEYADRVIWEPSILIKQSPEEIVSFINNNSIDVFCASVYIWNVDSILETLKGVRKLLDDTHNKSVKIVVGGPSCDAVNDDWETKYSFIDHCVVGQGEKAWAELVLDFLEIKKVDESTSNLVHFVKSGTAIVEKKYNYEFLRGIHYSPYIECEDMVVALKEKYKDYSLTWPYETARGCPYHCSFCDWNGGQSNKTQKRKIDFLEEVDFLAEHGMYDLYIADANFGMWDSDVEIMKRMVEHNKNGHKFNFVSFNISKKVDENFKTVMRLIVEHDFNSVWVKLSAQDIHQNVLEAIDRPGSWPQLKEFGLELYRTYGESKNLKKIYVELIIGLPEQTVGSYTETLDEVYGNGFIPRSYPFFLLRNSPATYDLEYRAKYGIKDDMIYETLDMEPYGETIKELLENTTENFIYKQMVSCNSYTSRDLVEMTMIDQLYRVMLSRTEWPESYGFIDTNWHHLKPILSEMIKTDDFQYVLSQRHHNFITYKINNIEGSHGKLLIRNLDLASVVSRNMNIIIDSFAKTKPSSDVQQKFLSIWNTFERHKHYLDR